ncbi:MAG: hypothetical protein HY319_19550 [Armatimonadetes bacterium]|nr:hypothetical protein [Armatimonadota bacterium]
MRSKALDLVLLLAAIALAAVFLKPREDVAVKPIPVRAPQVQGNARPAPEFELQRLGGGAFRYAGGEGPAFAIMSLVGCPDCTTESRYAEDRKAFHLAREAGLDTWHLFIGAPEPAAVMAADCQTAADHVLVDNQNVCIGKYKGRADYCWLLIDAQDNITWQGAPTCSDTFRQALAQVAQQG